MRRCTPHKETSHGIFLSHSALPFGVSLGKTGKFQPGLWSSCRAFTGARWLLRCGTCIGVDGGDDDNWGMVGKATVSAKLLRLQKDIVVTHFSSVWESSIDGERGTFSPHWFRSFQCARSSSMLHRRNLPLQLSSEDFPFENAQIFQTNQHNQSVFGIVRDKIQKALHL